jgi:ferrous iron transport protein A
MGSHVRRLSDFDPPIAGADERDGASAPLSSARKGFRGVIAAVRPGQAAGGLAASEIERRLVEMGFVEGASIEVLHEGLFGRDPMAVRLAERIVALRRREARAVLVSPRPRQAS